MCICKCQLDLTMKLNTNKSNHLSNAVIQTNLLNTEIIKAIRLV